MEAYRRIADRIAADISGGRLRPGQRLPPQRVFARRQRLVAEELGGCGFDVPSDPAAYFAWWRLPAPWRADTFTAAARAHGIALAPGTAFSVGAGRTPDAVRLGLASVPEQELARALRTLAGVARGAARA